MAVGKGLNVYTVINVNWEIVVPLTIAPVAHAELASEVEWRVQGDGGLIGVGRYEAHSLFFVFLVELDVEIRVDRECYHAVTACVFAVFAEDQRVVNDYCVDVSQRITCRLSLVFCFSREVISNDIGLLLLDVDYIIIDIQLHGLRVYQNGVDLNPMSDLKDELFRVTSKGYWLSVPVYQLDACRFQIKHHFSTVSKSGVDFSNTRIGRTRQFQVPIRHNIVRIAKLVNGSSPLMYNIRLLLQRNSNKLITAILARQQKWILIIKVILSTIDVYAELEVIYTHVSIRYI